MTEDPEMPAHRPVTESFERATLDVTLVDGTHRHAAVLVPRGHPQAALTEAELEGKFRGCAAGVLNTPRIDRVFACLAGLGALPQIRILAEALRMPA